MNKTIDIGTSFKPRPYQVPIWDAMKSYKRLILIMPRRCLSGNAHIILSDGSWKELKDISIGDKILSWNGHSFEEDRVKDVWKTEPKNIRLLRAGSYLDIITSDDHLFASPVSTIKCTNYKWRKASDLKVNNSHVLNYSGMQYGNLHDPDLAEFLGYMIADGYCVGYQQPKFTNINMTILKRVEELAMKLFDCKVIWRKKGRGYDLGFSNGTKGGGETRNSIKELFRIEGQDIPKSRKRFLSCTWLFDEPSIMRFIAAYISADGSIYTPQNKRRNIPIASEISISFGHNKDLAFDMYWLLRRIGIIPMNPSYERSVNYRIRITKNGAIKKILTNNRVYGKEDKQDRALANVILHTRQATIYDGCYRNRISVNNAIFKKQELYDLTTEKNHNFIANGYVVHNSGKDVLCFNIIYREALAKVGSYYYVFPTFSSGRRILWDQITMEGERILDYIPSQLIESKNEAMMRIKLINGSYIQVIGSDNFDNTLVGTNPRGIVFSEYALQSPEGYSYSIPILRANQGWAIFQSTPRGRNHFYELWNIAQSNPDVWFSYRLTINDTQHVSIEQIQSDVDRGEISQDLVQQEYFCSFDQGISGAFYQTQLDRMRSNFQIGSVPWEPTLKVHTAWDIGVRDSTVIIFFQNYGTTIRVIDYYTASSEGLEHYVRLINSKPYIYGVHLAPHDIKVKEFGTGMTRMEIANKMGLGFTLVPHVTLMDGIESVRASLAKIYIDDTKCKQLIKSLESYRREYDTEKKVYKATPLHDIHSHACFVGETLIITDKGNKPIKEIQVGMRVKTPFGFRRVLAIHKRKTDKLLKVTTKSSNFICTPDHDIFTQRGLVYSDSLRYTDVMEYNSMISGYLWKKIYGFYGEVLAIKGLKKSCLFLKMNQGSCLMDFVIGGMDSIIDREVINQKEMPVLYIERFICFIKGIFQRDIIFTILTSIRGIMNWIIFNVFQRRNILYCMQTEKVVGLSQINAKLFFDHSIQKHQNGIEVKRDDCGIKRLDQKLYRLYEEQSISKSVTCAQKNIMENKHGKGSVLMHVKQGIGSSINLISWIVLVISVKLYSIVINTLLKKHVVKHVQLYQLDQQKEVYDLTVDVDNCYYANGYLVSNSDAMRYLCVGQQKTKDGMTSDDLDRIYKEAVLGEQPLPRFFQDDIDPHWHW